ncbi:MAG: hypothetical protein AMXMBFR61_04360 [Fimbriimonadales bacterium]
MNRSKVITDRYVFDADGSDMAPGLHNTTEGNSLRLRWNGSYGYRTLYFLTGQQTTNTATLMHVGARHYSPSLRRWLQRDPIDIAAGDPNLYVYCGNCPVGLADPQGLDGFEFTWEGVKEGVKTGLCAVGEAFTFGLWRNEDYANKPGYGTSVALATVGREALVTAGAAGASKVITAARAARSARAAAATASASTSRTAPIVRGGIEFSKHAAERMAEHGVTSRMVETAILGSEEQDSHVHPARSIPTKWRQVEGPTGRDVAGLQARSYGHRRKGPGE